MWQTGVLLASQIAIQLAIWPLALALVVNTFRTRPRWPASLVVVALIVLLASTAVGAVIPEVPMIVGAAWWLSLPIILGAYPDGRFVPKWVVVPVVGFLLFAVAYVVTGGEIAERWGAVVGFSSLLLLGAPIYRYLRRSTTQERESTRWVVLSVLLGTAAYLILIAVEGGTVAEHGPVSLAAANVAGAIMPIGFALGLLRPRLIDVDRVLAAVIAALVSAGSIAAVALSSWSIAMAAWPDAAVVIVVVVAVALTVPIVFVARKAAAWIVFRGRLSEDEAIAAVDTRLATIADSASTASELLDVIVRSLRLSGAEIHGDAHLATAVGELGGGWEEFSVTYRGEPVALIRVAPRHGESSLSSYDRRVVKRLIAHAAPALRAARAVAELRDAHDATLRAREEERRRLRRDLHDDLSPTLAGLSLSAAAITQRARQGGDVAADVESLAGDVQSAMAQTRELAYGLRPPILDDLGLLAAIRSRVHGASADDLEVYVEGDDLPSELPAAVDLAALRITQEAVENCRRHAAAHRCEVHISVTRDTLLLTIEDDGVGFSVGRPRGLGLASIRDRADELGGTAEFGRSRLGGAGIRVNLPLASVSR